MSTTHQFVIIARPEHKAAGIIVAAQAAQMVATALNACDAVGDWEVVTAPGAAWEAEMEIEAEKS